MSLLRRALLAGLALVCAGPAVAGFEEDYEARQWQEMVVQLPKAPQSESLLPFFVSAASDNKFFVDGSTLSVGEDGVVRYALVVLAPAGGRNVSFEGLRCETKEWRIYASGRNDGSWSKSRVNQWTRIQDAAGNRHHAALYLDYFCPGGAIVRNTAEALDAFKRGGYGGAWMRW